VLEAGAGLRLCFMSHVPGPPCPSTNVRHTMPSDLAILLGLLRYGALPAAEKVRVLGDYQARSDSSGGGPHIWNPSVEVIESLCAN